MHGDCEYQHAIAARGFFLWRVFRLRKKGEAKAVPQAELPRFCYFYISAPAICAVSCPAERRTALHFSRRLQEPSCCCTAPWNCTLCTESLHLACSSPLRFMAVGKHEGSSSVAISQRVEFGKLCFALWLACALPDPWPW